METLEHFIEVNDRVIGSVINGPDQAYLLMNYSKIPLGKLLDLSTKESPGWAELRNEVLRRVPSCA